MSTTYRDLEAQKYGSIEEARAVSELFDYDSLNPKEMVKSNLNWYNQPADLPSYSPTANNLIQFYLPRDGIYVPHESYFSLTLTPSIANSAGNVAGTQYATNTRLENIYSIIQSVSITVGNETVYNFVQGYPSWKAIQYSYASPDFISTVLTDTGYALTNSEKNYMSGTYLGAEDATAVHNAWGLPDGGAGVIKSGYTYRLKLDSILDSLKAVPLNAMPRIRISILLNPGTSCMSNLIANTVAGYTLTNVVYHMRMLEVPTALSQEIRLKQIEADRDLARGSIFEYENVYHNTFTLPANSAGQQSFQFNVNIEECKSIFIVFRNSTLINVSNTGANGNYNDNQNSNFIAPFDITNADWVASRANFQYQFVCDAEYYPKQPVIMTGNDLVEASSMMMEAMGTLNDVELGQRYVTPAFTQPGNFILGVRLKPNHDTKSGKYIGTLNMNLTWSGISSPNFSIYGDVFIPYESTLVCSASTARLVTSRP